jgi:pseudaminic acid biosynthesis-associated methylase
MSVDLWRGQFGNEYTARNTSATLGARWQLWTMLLPLVECRSILEVGANTGLNLQAIGDLTDAELYATEPNEMAREELCDWLPATHVFADTADSLGLPDRHCDLVFTCGVLIHVPPDKLLKSAQEIHRVSRRYIICAEYFAPSEEMVPYRGHNNALWRRDYGSLFLDNFSDLRCVAAPVFAWKRLTGLDNLTIWIMEKGRRPN